jgi:pseudaminic acid cytidylyltransferase
MNLAIIPARVGSKRIKKKNIISFFNQPIISYSIKKCINSKLFEKVIVSTDSTEIKEIAEKFGAYVPFLRPKKISNDQAVIREVVQHCIFFLKKKKINFKNICCVFPTAPLIQISDIIKGFNKLNSGWDSVFSAVSHEKSVLRSFVLANNEQVKFIREDFYSKSSQSLPRSYYDAGQFYWGTEKFWLAKNFLSKKISIIQIQKKFVQDLDDKVDLKILKNKAKILWKK